MTDEQEIANLRYQNARLSQNLQGQKEYFCYWLLRAYQSGHREGWEDGPSVQQTMNDLLNVLANEGFDPSSTEAADLLKIKFAYFLESK